MIRLLLSLGVLALLGCTGNSNILTIQAVGCTDRNEKNVCNDSPTYIGEIQLIVSKEARTVTMTQIPKKGINFLFEGNFLLTDCAITDSKNWSCKEKSSYGELYFIHEMVDGVFIKLHKGEIVNGSLLSYVGYQGFRGLLVKHNVWQPKDYFKSGK